MNYKYAKIITDNRALELDRAFTYAIADSMIGSLKPGMRVVIPFGRGNRNIKGLIISLTNQAEGNYQIKEIIDSLDEAPIVSGELLELSRWISNKYLSSYMDALNLVLPPGDFKEIETYISLINKPDKILGKDIDMILSYLIINKKTKLSDLKKNIKVNNINQLIKKMETKGYINISIDIKTKIRKKKEKRVRTMKGMNLSEAKLSLSKRASRQIQALEYIYKVKDTSIKELMQELQITYGPLKALYEKKLIDIYSIEVDRDVIPEKIKDYKRHSLNSEQKLALDKIINSHREKFSNKHHLLVGVTGSGKTEIYLQLVEEMIKDGLDSIILVPEISLTPQTVERFVGRFGEQVAILHSRLSDGERFDQWRKIREGRVKIAIGARSGIFAPFNNLGLIIIDEEHEDSYKSEKNPKYDTIEVAKKRAEMNGASLVLGTATPSIESYYRANQGEYKISRLEKRATKAKLPEIKVVDMKEELNNGNKGIFSKDLYESIADNIKKGEQTILFLNRRGFSTFVSCRSCGYVVKCNDCEVSMTYHRRLNRLKCHYCGKTRLNPTICPACSSPYIKHFGIGTEQLEYITKETFLNARVLRVDADTMGQKNSYDEMFKAMKDGSVDILIGTQMISKGLDFKNVTLVGIVAADTTLNLPDFRSSERNFQLITQVAGRAGRGDRPGQVILQTYQPEHYSIVSARNYNYSDFYETEIKLRKAFYYPPYVNFINILIYGEENNKVAKIASDIGFLIREEYKRVIDCREDFVTGPYPAPMERIKRNFRHQILLKVTDEDMFFLREIVKGICIENKYKLDYSCVKVSIDINPISIL